MPSVHLICLANSHKHDPGRCIAGLRRDGKGWLRLVSTHGEGELWPHECMLPDGSEPRMLDIIRVGAARRVPEPWQPENCIIDDSAGALVERPTGPDYAAVVCRSIEHSPLLFGDEAPKIARAALEASPAANSLALVAPDRIGWLTAAFGQKRRARVRFRLGPCSYTLPLTDPFYGDALRNLPEGEHAGSEIGIPNGARVLLTVSLAGPHTDGFCYKLAANVVLLPEAWAGALALTSSAGH